MILKVSSKQQAIERNHIDKKNIAHLGGTPLQEANGDVPLDGVAFSRPEWV